MSTDVIYKIVMLFFLYSTLVLTAHSLHYIYCVCRALTKPTFLSRYLHGNIYLNRFLDRFSGSFPTSQGYLSPYCSVWKIMVNITKISNFRIENNLFILMKKTRIFCDVRIYELLLIVKQI